MKKQRITRVVSVEVDPAIFANLPKGVKISVSHGFLRNQCPAFAALGYMKKEDIEAALADIRGTETEKEGVKTVGTEMAAGSQTDEQPKRSETRTSGMAPEREEKEEKTSFRLVEITEDECDEDLR